MPEPETTIVIPTLHGGPLLQACLASLDSQTRRDFEIVIVDNSGSGVVPKEGLPKTARVIENRSNVGFGAAVNQAVKQSKARYIAVLNDDTTVAPGWLQALGKAMESDKRVGMCACRIRLAMEGVLDSAGMLLCPDGSSKQRGFGEAPSKYPDQEPALFPSGAAAMYRRAMLEDLGGFDESFFLYCEDTDLGLRAAWAGWRCLYVPAAEVDHHYSSSAGRVSPLKVYYVERNRLFVLLKNFPLPMLLAAPGALLARYFWHAISMGGGTSAAARFRESHSAAQLVFIVVRAHLSLLKYAPGLLRKRRSIRASAKVSREAFQDLCRQFVITPRQVATQ